MIFQKIKSLAKKIVNITDFRKKNKKFTFPIIPINKVKSQKIDSIFVCVNPNYYNIILNKLNNKKIEIFLPFQKMKKH